MTEAIVLAIVVPIFAALLSMLAGLLWARSGWLVAIVAMLVEVGLATTIALTVARDGSQSYELAGFSPPAGIELVADGLSTPVIVLVATVALAVLVYSRRAGPRGNTFYTVYLLLVAGLAGVTLTGDVFNMYVFLEITGLAAYALVASGDSPRSAVASLKYLVIGTIGASLFLLGIGYAYVATGTLNMVDLSEQLTATAEYTDRLVLAAFGLMITGMLVKVALFPVHTWQPDAYATAPDSVSAYISALVSTVAAYAVARLLFTVFTVDFLSTVPLAQNALLYAATVSIVAGSVLAVMQTEVKRMLAYSSVSQFGMIIAAFALATQSAVVGGVVHLIGHAVLKGGLFASAGIVARQTGARTISEYAGLARRHPLSACVIAVLGLSLVGLPPSVGFVGKWYIAVGAVESGAWPIAAIIFLSTMLTLAYVARVVERMFFAPLPSGESVQSQADGVSADGGEEMPLSGDDSDVSPGMIAVIVLAAIAAVALGFAGSAIESFLAEAFFESTPMEVFGR
jgi:multicomponent Na+:H+ antiporter subunit D